MTKYYDVARSKPYSIITLDKYLEEQEYQSDKSFN